MRSNHHRHTLCGIPHSKSMLMEGEKSSYGKSSSFSTAATDRQSLGNSQYLDNTEMMNLCSEQEQFPFEISSAIGQMKIVGSETDLI